MYFFVIFRQCRPDDVPIPGEISEDKSDGYIHPANANTRHATAGSDAGEVIEQFGFGMGKVQFVPKAYPRLRYGLDGLAGDS